MRNHDNSIRGFFRRDKSYYADSLAIHQPSIMFGMYDPAGGTSGEMEMEWISLSNKLVPKLKCYQDSWDALNLFSDVIAELAKYDMDSTDNYLSDDEFVEILNHLGFKDMTKYTENNKKN